MRTCDVLVVGGGIAGSSAAYELAAARDVVLVERETRPGYHSTGRSAALFTETYGNAVIRALTTGSKPFYLLPPPGFSDHPVLTPRGALLVARADQADLLDGAFREMSATGAKVHRLDRQEVRSIVPVIRGDNVAGGLHEPDAMDLDVHSIHQGYLRGLRARGGMIPTDADVVSVTRSGERWLVDTPGTSFSAATFVNAAGAWADVVAGLGGVRPIGLVPKRRSVFTFEAPEGIQFRTWPAVIDLEETFYFKPDAGVLLGSPANEDAVLPHDVQPEEIDIALGISRIEEATTLTFPRIRSRWAGLRSFVADKTLVAGFDPGVSGFFWLAGQGGYGIQTAPAMARITAASVLGESFPRDLSALGLNPSLLAPDRFRS
jgi:D-arginine dehydrogenase